eukprot:CAMPEP_0197047584 /NCGR_PEP_ID=MMETSP1384-20130603/23065_1 /TAXON_ID=29189 /ORGANISM="Ammonia sp." /LENGTH=91 /DNA_ID=CAMNT_0042479537 /DNA_START=111 /DNA_END=382 /DNA_ORIENTATION=+
MKKTQCACNAHSMLPTLPQINIVQLDDVRMVQTGKQFDLFLEQIAFMLVHLVEVHVIHEKALFVLSSLDLTDSETIPEFTLSDSCRVPMQT